MRFTNWAIRLWLRYY